MKEALDKRIKEIEATIANVVTQHTQLTGHLNEAKFMLQTIFNAEAAANPAVAAVVPAIEAAIPVVEGAIGAVESAISGKEEGSNAA